MTWYVEFIAICLLAVPLIRLIYIKFMEYPEEGKEHSMEFYTLQNELNGLYYERDLLLELASRASIGTDLETVGTKELKAALTLEKQIHAINKKIEKIENKLAELD